MRTVWKFTSDLLGRVVIPPCVGKVVHVGEQHGKVAVWIEVDPGAECTRNIELYLAMTGEPLPSGNLEYRGTAILQNGSFVVHVYEDVVRGVAG